MRIFAQSIAVILFALVMAENHSAQQPVTGQIRGHVIDSVGATIKGASVFIHRNNSEEGNVRLSAHTDIHGDFVLVLPEGGYDVFITSPGFISAVKTAPVWRGKTQKLEWRLKALGCDFPGMNCDTFR